MSLKIRANVEKHALYIANGLSGLNLKKDFGISTPFLEQFKSYLSKLSAVGIDMETATLFIVGHSNEIARGALLLVSDMPLVPEGVKTESSDKMVTEKYSNLHLQIGIEAMTEIGEKGEEIKHFRY